MSEGWKRIAIKRINALIDRLELEEDIEHSTEMIMLIDNCPVCQFVKDEYLINTNSPEYNCNNKDGDLCPAIESCLKFLDIRNDTDITIKDRILKLNELVEEIEMGQ